MHFAPRSASDYQGIVADARVAWPSACVAELLAEAEDAERGGEEREAAKQERGGPPTLVRARKRAKSSRQIDKVRSSARSAREAVAHAEKDSPPRAPS